MRQLRSNCCEYFSTVVADSADGLLRETETGCLRMTLNMSLHVCPANWLPLEWPLLSTSVSRSKWAVIVAMINGQLSRKPVEGGREVGRAETRMRQRKLYAGCGVGPSDEQALGFVIICDLC